MGSSLFFHPRHSQNRHCRKRRRVAEANHGWCARVQRPLWPGTGTRNPEYSDTIYVDSLVAPDTVNTVPASTLDAFIDHGSIGQGIDPEPCDALERIEQLLGPGVDLNVVCEDCWMKGSRGLHCV